MLLSCFVVLTGCGGGSGDPGPRPVITGDVNVDNYANSLTGTWTTGCIGDEFLGNVVKDLEFSPYHAKFSLRFYDGPGCVGEVLTASEEYEVSYRDLFTVARGLSGAGRQALEFDLTSLSVSDGLIERGLLGAQKKIYDIVHIDEDSLYTGLKDSLDTDGSSPETRPHSIDLTVSYSRVN